MRKENGYIVVETVGSFTLFVFLVIAILTLINVVTVQARMHYALTQTAETVSMYAYTLDLMGLSEKIQGISASGSKVEKSAQELADNVNNVIDAIEGLDLQDAKNSAGALVGQVKTGIQSNKENPKAILQTFLNWGIRNGVSEGFEITVLRPLVTRYLANGTSSGEEFLEQFHVINGADGLNFHDVQLPMSWDSSAGRLTAGDSRGSMILDENGDVRIVVKYSIDYTFGALPLPFDGGLKIIQSVTTKAWGRGTGKGYRSNG